MSEQIDHLDELTMRDLIKTSKRKTMMVVRVINTTLGDGGVRVEADNQYGSYYLTQLGGEDKPTLSVDTRDRVIGKVEVDRVIRGDDR